jgi:hypothetical protein
MAVAMSVPTNSARAETYHTCNGFIDSLPATITTQGTWCLRKDLGTAMTSGDAITVATNNVTIDCNRYKIGGLAAGSGTAARGIHAQSKLNIAVRNCNVRGFARGIYIIFGGAHLVEQNDLDSNTIEGIVVVGAGSMVRGNRVIDTGGSTANTGLTSGIRVQGGVDVIDNTVNGVAAPDYWSNGSADDANGIIASSNGGGSVTGNRVSSLVPFQNGWTYGIRSSNSGRMVIRDNDLQGNGGTGYGITCSNNQSTARDNIVSGFSTGVSFCASFGNYINSN